MGRDGCDKLCLICVFFFLFLRNEGVMKNENPPPTLKFGVWVCLE